MNEERGPPPKGCIRNGIISLSLSFSPYPRKRGKYFFRAEIAPDSATFQGSREQSRERDADNNLGVAGRFVPGARRETARRVCKVCESFSFFFSLPPLPHFFFDTAKRARAHPPATLHGDYDGVEKYAPGVCHLQSRRERGLAPDEFLIADEEKGRPRCASMPCRKKKRCTDTGR